jgi:hypothetical protein
MDVTVTRVPILLSLQAQCFYKVFVNHECHYISQKTAQTIPDFSKDTFTITEGNVITVRLYKIQNEKQTEQATVQFQAPLLIEQPTEEAFSNCIGGFEFTMTIRAQVSCCGIAAHDEKLR